MHWQYTLQLCRKYVDSARFSNRLAICSKCSKKNSVDKCTNYFRTTFSSKNCSCNITCINNQYVLIRLGSVYTCKFIVSDIVEEVDSQNAPNSRSRDSFRLFCGMHARVSFRKENLSLYVRIGYYYNYCSGLVPLRCIK